MNTQNILTMVPSTTKRFYQTVYKNHDNEILGMFCLRSNELLSFDSEGGLKRLNIDTLISETLEIFGDSKYRVTCVKSNEEGDSLFFGLESGAIWTSDLTTSDELVYSHSLAVTAIASTKSTVFSAGLDLKIKMFNLKTQSIIANIDCQSEVNILHPLSNIFGLPLVVGDVSGCVSIWSPHLLKSSTQSVQLCCQLQSKILSICQVTLFNRACIVCTTSSKISIYAIAVKKNGTDKDHISLLKDEIYSLVRVITPVNYKTQFLSCITMSYLPPSSSNSSTSSAPSPIDMNVNSNLLSACSDGFVYQWEPLTAQVLRRYRVTNDSNLPCLSLIYLPTYQMFAATDSQNSLYLMNYSATPLVTSIPIFDVFNSTLTPAASSSTSAAVAASASRRVHITCAAVMDIHSTLISYGDSNGQLHLYNNLNQESHSKPLNSITATTAIALVYLNSTDDLVIVSGHSNGTLLFFISSVDGVAPSLEKARQQQISSVYNTKITSIQTIASESIATASEMESVIIWKLNPKGMIKVTQLVDSTQMLAVISHPDGYLIGSDPTHQLHIWNINQNWKKIVPSPSSLTHLTTSRALTSPRSAHITTVKQKLGLYFEKKKGIHYIATAVTNLTSEHQNNGENKIKFYKIVNCCELLLDGIVELPIQCSDIAFWSHGESNLVFVQSAVDGKISSINMQSYDSINNFTQSRDFLSYQYLSNNQSSDCHLVGVSGNTSPVVLTCETLSSPSLPHIQILQVWNNDLHDLDQFYSSSLQIALNVPSLLDASSSSGASSNLTEDYLSRIIESHPHFPASLLIPEVTALSSQSFFFSALLNTSGSKSFPSAALSASPASAPPSRLLQKYLPLIPIAVTQLCYLNSSKQSLLSLALHLKESLSIDVILTQWVSLLLHPHSSSYSSSSSLSSQSCLSQYHVMELFQDWKLLAYLQPAKYSQFVQQLPLLINHSVLQKNYPSHKMTSSSFSSPTSALLGSGDDDVCMMRGTEYRVIPSFWSLLNDNSNDRNASNAVKGPYPDLMSRVLSPEEEDIYWLPFEQPHSCKSLQQVYTAGIEHRSPHTQQKKFLLSLQSSLGRLSQEEDLEEEKSNNGRRNGGDNTRNNNSEKMMNEIMSPPENIGEGVLVQSYIHPIPNAAAGIDFLLSCQTTHHLTGSKSSLLAAPLVSSVIDYKWNSYFSKSHHSRVIHSLFLLILFSFHCIYYEELTNSPSKTGLPFLVFIISLFLIGNYLLLMVDTLLRLLIEKPSITLRDPWFYVAIAAYFSVVTGVMMILLCDNGDSGLKKHTSFNARCVVSAASLLLYLQFLHSLMPLQSIGLFIHRLLLTLQYTTSNYFLLLFCILSFSVSFNLMHHRHQNDDETTFNSFYGSFLQSFIYAFGGYNSQDLFDTADSPLIMSLYFPLFIILLLWILLLHLLINMNEIFNKTELKATCLWRENQIRIILLKSLLLTEEEIQKNIFHNPKWLHILKPLYQQEFPVSSSSSSSSTATSAWSAFSSLPNDGSTKDSIDDIRRDVELLKDLFYQVQDSINGCMRQQLLSQQQMNSFITTTGAALTAISSSNSNYNETQLLNKIQELLSQHCCNGGAAKPSTTTTTTSIPNQITVQKLPPIEVDLTPATPTPTPAPVAPSSPRPPLNTRALSRAYSTTDNDDTRPPNDNEASLNSPNTQDGKNKKLESGLRVRQVKSSKKKLSSKISGVDFDPSA